MLRKLTAAGLVAGAALGAVLMAAPAQAADQQFNQNLQVVPVTVCNANASVLGITVPVLSPQTTGDCTNGPINTTLSSKDAYEAIPQEGSGRQSGQGESPGYTGY
ncbi:hypothetical protein [Salinactinospora qingdaonensis]